MKEKLVFHNLYICWVTKYAQTNPLGVLESKSLLHCLIKKSLASWYNVSVFNTIEKCVADTYKSLMHLKSGAYDKDEHRVIFFLNALQIKSFKYQYDRRNNVEAEWIISVL